jgi:hypothetical protein
MMMLNSLLLMLFMVMLMPLTRGAIVLDGSVLPNKAPTRRSKSAAVIQSLARVGRGGKGEKRLLQLIDENTK